MLALIWSLPRVALRFTTCFSRSPAPRTYASHPVASRTASWAKQNEVIAGYLPPPTYFFCVVAMSMKPPL